MTDVDTMTRTETARQTPSAALLDAIRARQDEIEAGNRLPRDLVDDMRRDGLFRVAVPAAYGGRQLGPHELIDVIRLVSAADGSAGLVLANAIVWQVFTARLPRQGYEDLYGDGPDVVLAGSFNGRASAVPVDGGFVVSGRWSFASGCENASWLLGVCSVAEGEGHTYEPGERVVAYVPAADVTIERNWSVAGMEGTGSHDFSVDSVFVPTRRTYSMYRNLATGYGGLYDAPVMSVLALVAAPVAIGVSEAAIGEICRLAAVKTPLRTQGNAKVRDRAVVKLAVAEAEADRLSALALMRTAADIVAGWPDAAAGGDPNVLRPLEERARIRLCATHATRLAAEAAKNAYTAGGATSIRKDSSLQRYFRNAHTMTQLSIVADAQYELVADVLLGIDLANGEYL